MWKDFFHYSKLQRRGIIVLIILIILIVILDFTLPLFFSSPDMDNTAFVEEVDEFKRNLISRDSLKRVEQERLQAEKENRFNQKEKRQNYSLFPFDPNTVDSITLVSLGIKPYVAGNIIKYRSKGGKFNTSGDFQKIYGITEAKFKELESYIVIRQEKKEEPEKIKTTLDKVVEEKFVVELNSADTTELMKIKGVGRYYAREIVKYRKELGGFISVDQLLEIKNMRPESFDKIVLFCIVDNKNIDKINVNKASVDYMKRHPYINFYQAKAIYELRRMIGKLNNINELTKLPDFSEEDRLKIEPYLSFE